MSEPFKNQRGEAGFAMTWQIEVRHDGLQKYRVVKGSDKHQVEQKVRAQLLAWDEQYSRKLISNAARAERDLVRLTRETGKKEAEQRTHEAQLAIDAAKSILQYTLKVDDRIAWDELKSKTPFPKPQPSPPAKLEIPPAPEFTAPSRTVLDWLVPGRRRRSLESAHESFEDRKRSWSGHAQRLKAAHDSRLSSYEQDMASWRKEKLDYEQRQQEDNDAIDAQKRMYMEKDADAVSEYIELVLSRSVYPRFIGREYQVEYSSDQGIAVIDLLLPNPEDIPQTKDVKYIASNNSLEERHLKPKELEQLYDSVIYQISLRTLHEIYESDTADTIHAIVFNGFVNYIDRSIGNEVRACILSVHTTRSDFLRINLSAVDPKQCFRSLKGIAAPQLATLTPVAPILQLRRDDPRFVTGEGITSRIDDHINIAAIGWEEFEHLIREIFEQEFSNPGSEVKVTRATRDAGVDAVIFDPDPVRGGKIVVQAKRYTNTVDVSAVRDLYGAVLNEGASKGILVTTSNFGPDAYGFAQGKPLSLINGQNLLFLLEKHGKKARIDLHEAKGLGVGLQRRTLIDG